VPRGNPVFNREALVGYLAVVALVIAVRFLNGRFRPLTMVAVVAPLVLLLFVLGALEIDRFLPALR
jgi:hypothetical protein